MHILYFWSRKFCNNKVKFTHCCSFNFLSCCSVLICGTCWFPQYCWHFSVIQFVVTYEQLSVADSKRRNSEKVTTAGKSISLRTSITTRTIHFLFRTKGLFTPSVRVSESIDESIDDLEGSGTKCHCKRQSVWIVQQKCISVNAATDARCEYSLRCHFTRLCVSSWCCHQNQCLVGCLNVLSHGVLLCVGAFFLTR